MAKVARRRLEEALRLLGADPATADALTRADAFWLARVLPGGDAPADETGATTGAAGSRADAPPPPAESPATGPAPAPDTDAPPPPADTTKAGADTTALFVQQAGAEDEPQLHARRVPVPAADALPGRAAIERALRPFLRRRPSRVRRMVDAEATAEASAQASADALLAAAPGERATPALVPVLRPVPERWFDMVLLAEQDDTMRVFEDTLKELRQLLARHGAFRRVGLWRWSVRDGEVHVQTASGMPSAPRAMLQGQHPQLIWVLTHGGSTQWDKPPLRDFVRSLAAHAVVAVVQLLPEAAWGATMLGESRERVRSRERAATNRQLLKRDLWTALWAREGALGVVPMLSLQADSVARWAEFVMSPRALEHAAVAVDDIPAPARPGKRPAAAGADPQDAIREQVQAFRAIASPQAFALLRLLSGAWITLPVMRLLLQSMPGPRALAPMAEVLLSGLLQRTSKADARTEELTFDFAPGVREWLSGSLSGDERRALDKAMADSKEAIRQFVETKLNRSFTSFSALLVDPEGTELLPASAKSFVEVSQKLRNLRGASPVSAPAVAKPGPAPQPQPRTVRKLRILHLSDLHIGREKPMSAWRSRPMMGKAWLDNLHAIQAEGPIDLVCLTGDVANTGRAEEYDEATHFISELMSTLQLPIGRFFCVPGNHDIERGVVSDTWAAMRRTPSHQDPDSGQIRPMLLRQADFRRWMRGMGQSMLNTQLGYRAQVDLGLGAPLNIIGLDSAWMAGADDDEGKLRLTDVQLSRLVMPNFPRGWGIALMHHPLTALADGEDANLRLGYNGVALLLHGHQHDLRRANWNKTHGGTHVVSSGCLYEHEGANTGVQVLDVELHPGNADSSDHLRLTRISSRIWSADGNWQSGGNIEPKDQPTVLPEATTSTASPPPSPHIFIGRQRELALMREALLPGEGSQPRNVALLGAPGIGKTALTQEFLLQHGSRDAGRHSPFAGRYSRFALGLRSTEGYTAETLAQMVAGHISGAEPPDGAPPEWLWNGLQRELQVRPRLLIFDDVDTTSVAAAMNELARRLPGCPIIATSRLQMFDRDWVTIELTPLSLQEACELLRAEVAADGTGRILTDAAAEEIASIAGYLPAALRLAARRWAQGVMPQELRGELHDGRTEAPPPVPPPADEPKAAEQVLSAEEKVTIQQALGVPGETATQGATTLTVFISAVGSEFGDYRDELRRRLTRPGIRVVIQSDFWTSEASVLLRLDEAIRNCDIVIHLVGDACGINGNLEGDIALADRHSDLLKRLPALRANFSGDGRPPSLQQWEAWLGLYHGKAVIVAKPTPDAPRGSMQAPDDEQVQRQRRHLDALEHEREIYGEIVFSSVDELSLRVQQLALFDLLLPNIPTEEATPPAPEPSRVTLDLSDDDRAKLNDLASSSPPSETERFREELAELQAAQKASAEPPISGARKNGVYISAVPSEFGEYFDALRHLLNQVNIRSITPEDLPTSESSPLLQLDDRLLVSDAIVHLVGESCGADPTPEDVRALMARYPDLPSRTPSLRDVLAGDAPALSYTQWEAWLAHYHGLPQLVARASPDTPRHARTQPDASQQDRQRRHIAMLERVRPVVSFSGRDDLFRQVLQFLAPTAGSTAHDKPPPLKVFLSYTSVDIAAARELRRRLREDGHAPWLAEDDLLPGQNWQVETTRALREADVVLVCLSNHSLAKPGFAEQEVRMALEAAAKQPAGSIYLIPVRLEHCEVPKELAQWHWVDYFAEDGYRRLLGALEAKRTQPSLPAAPPAPDTTAKAAPQAAAPAPASGRPSIFLSYARENVKAVRKLVLRLENLGFNCVWFDVFDTHNTDSSTTHIDAAMQACDFFMPVLSNTADQRPHGRYWEEWAWAVKRSHERDGDFLLPVGLDKRPPDRMDYKRIFAGPTAELAKGTLLHAREGDLDDKSLAELTRLLTQRGGPDAVRRGPRFYVSYAHQDGDHARRLLEHMRVLHRTLGAEIFMDTQLAPGDDWTEQLQAAMDRSDAFVLLLSPNYLSSNFCIGREAPSAMESMRTRGAKVHLVLLADCDWTGLRPDRHQGAPALGEIQATGPYDSTGRLVPMTGVQNADAAWVQIVQRIANTQLLQAR